MSVLKIQNDLGEWEGIPSIKGERGEQGEKGEQGEQGLKGENGFSPTANVNKVGKIATITITDEEGTTTAQISDGEGTTYTAGTGINITDDIISVDNNIATKSYVDDNQDLTTYYKESTEYGLPISKTDFNKFIANMLNNYYFDNKNKKYEMIYKTQFGLSMERFSCIYDARQTGDYYKIGFRVTSSGDNTGTQSYYGIGYVTMGNTYNHEGSRCLYVLKSEYDNQNITQVFSDTDGNKNDISYWTPSSAPIGINNYYQQNCPLGVANSTEYTPTGDYNPATKKYVDDSITTALGSIETALDNIINGGN